MSLPGVRQSKAANAVVSINPLSGRDVITDAVFGGKNPPPIKWKPGAKSKFKPRGDDGKEIREEVKPTPPEPPSAPTKQMKKAIIELKVKPAPLKAKKIKGLIQNKPADPAPHIPVAPIFDPIAGVDPAFEEEAEEVMGLPPRDVSPQEYKKDAEWFGKAVSLMFPCGKDTNPATAVVVGACGLDIGKEKLRIDYGFGGSMIYKKRNRMAHDFLKTECEWSLWLDDDMIPPIGRSDWFKRIGYLPKHFPDSLAGRHFVHRLMEQGATGKKIVGGMYFGRKPDGPPIMGDGSLVEEAYRGALQFKDVVMAVDWVGTGCLLVHRSVYLAIQQKFPELAPNADYKYWNYFLPLPGKGEDKALCLRAKQCGIQAYVDLGCPCLHVGSMAFYAHNVKPGEQD